MGLRWQVWANNVLRWRKQLADLGYDRLPVGMMKFYESPKDLFEDLADLVQMPGLVIRIRVWEDWR